MLYIMYSILSEQERCVHIFCLIAMQFFAVWSSPQQEPLAGVSISPSCFSVAHKTTYSALENAALLCVIHSKQYKDLCDAASKQRGFGKHCRALRIKSTRNIIQHDSKPASLHSDLCVRSFFFLHKLTSFVLLTLGKVAQTD